MGNLMQPGYIVLNITMKHFYLNLQYVTYSSAGMRLEINSLCSTEPSLSLPCYALLRPPTLHQALHSASGSHCYEIKINENGPKYYYHAETYEIL